MAVETSSPISDEELRDIARLAATEEDRPIACAGVESFSVRESRHESAVGNIGSKNRRWSCRIPIFTADARVDAFNVVRRFCAH